MRTFNLRLMLWLAGIFLVTAAGVHLLHGYQVRRNAGVYRERAAQEEQVARDESLPQEERADAVRKALGHYWRYLVFQPSDTPVRVAYGKLLVYVGDYGQAYSQLERVLREDSDNDEIRRMQIDVTLRAGYLADAEDHIEFLLKRREGKDGDLLRLRGMALARQGAYPDAADSFREAFRVDPTQLLAYKSLADLQRTGEDTAVQADPTTVAAADGAAAPADASPADEPLTADDAGGEQSAERASAEQTIEQMVAANPMAAQAYLLRAEFQLQSGELLKEAREALDADVTKAVELAPTADEQERPGLLAYAAYCRRYLGQFDAARELLNDAIALAPQNTEFYVRLIELEQIAAQGGSLATAVATARRGLEAIPHRPANFDLRWRLAQLLMEDARQKELQLDRKLEELERLRRAQASDDALQAETDSLRQALNQSRREAQQLLAALEQDRADSVEVVFLKALQQFSDENWFEARQLLESKRSEFRRLPPAVAQTAERMLAFCYGQLNDADLQLLAYRRLMESEPGNFIATMNYAEALSRTGRTADALNEYDRLERQLKGKEEEQQNLPGLNELIVNVIKEKYRVQLSQGGSDASAMDLLTKLLGDIETRDPDDSSLPVNRAQLALRRGQVDEARAILMAARDLAPNQLSLWLALVNLAIDQQNFEEAARMLDEVEEKFGDSPNLRMNRANLIAQRDGQDGLPQLEAVVQDIDGVFSKSVQSQLLASLANLCLTQGDRALGIEYGRRAAAMDKNNLLIRMSLLRLARLEGSVELAEQLAAEINEVDKGGAVTLYAQANVALIKYTVALKKKVDQVDTNDLDDAVRILGQAEQKRPNWSELQIMLGTVARLKNDNDSALRYFQRAIDLGSRDATVMGDTVMLLWEQERISEALAVAQKLSELQQMPLDVARRVGEVMFQQSEYALARTMFEIPIQSNVVVPRDFLMKALVLISQRQFQEGLTALNTAIELDPTSAFARSVAIQTLVTLAANADGAGNQEVAQQLRGEAQQVFTQGLELVAPNERRRFEAESLVLLGKYPEAQECFKASLAETPNDPALLRSAARFYLRFRGLQQLAVPILTRLATGDVTDDAAAQSLARRELALLQGGRAGYMYFQEAMQLSDANLHVRKESDRFWPEELTLDEEELAEALKRKDGLEDLWVRARILAQRGFPSLQREALRILERFQSLPRAMPGGVKALMADLYLNLGDRTKGTQQLLSVMGEANEAGRSGQFAQYLVRYINLLLENAETREALDTIRRLRQVAPKSFQASLLEARALLPKKARDAELPPWRLDDALQIAQRAVDDPEVQPHNSPRLDANTKRLAVAQFLQDVLEEARKNRTTEDHEQIRAAIEGYFEQILADAAVAEQEPNPDGTGINNVAGWQLVRVPFLVRQGQRAEAMELLSRYWEQVPPSILIDAAAALLNFKEAEKRLDTLGLSEPERQQQQTALQTQAAETEQILVKALDKYRAQAGDDAQGTVQNLLMLLAGGLYLHTQRYDEAVGAYRQLLSMQAENVVALNNTAMIIAASNPAQALQQIRDALKLVGPAPTIVDSYAMILLANGQKAEALQSIQRVMSERPYNLDPYLNEDLARQWGGYYFHWAVILEANDKPQEAAKAMDEALRLGLREEDVFEPELPLWRKMTGKA